MARIFLSFRNCFLPTLLPSPPGTLDLVDRWGWGGRSHIIQKHSGTQKNHQFQNHELENRSSWNVYNSYWIAKNVLPKLAIKMHSQTVWMLVFYLFCCLTSLLGYLLIGLNVSHTNNPSCRFFSIPRQSGMYVSQWKKPSKGNHMKQNYTPDLVLNKWQNIQENLCNEYYHFNSFKNGPKV